VTVRLHSSQGTPHRALFTGHSGPRVAARMAARMAVSRAGAAFLIRRGATDPDVLPIDNRADSSHDIV